MIQDQHNVQLMNEKLNTIFSKIPLNNFLTFENLFQNNTFNLGLNSVQCQPMYRANRDKEVYDFCYVYIFFIKMKEELIPKYQNVNKKTFLSKLLGKKTPYFELKDRKIVLNIPDKEIGNNQISTSKYNLLSFPIFNLIQQFTKPSNIYFLLVGILQIIPAITVSEGKPTMFLPLVIVVLISMIKDFFEDWKRRMSDKKQNQSQTEILGEFGFTKAKWEDILVGDIIKVYKDQYFPCDVLLLQHGQQSDFAYVQTKNLDGETNLKLKKVPNSLNFLQKERQSQLFNMHIEIMYEKPNPFIQLFNGNINLNNKKYPLEPINVILRGSSLKINSYAICCCIYNGHETKAMMNSTHNHPKRSTLELQLNWYFKCICLFQGLTALLLSLIYGIIVKVKWESVKNISQSDSFFLNALSTWGSWFISICNFIPISLLVTLQMIRYGQGYLLNKDPKCCTKGFKAEVQTSSVNEQLGQIQYILSDKTGTLTQNSMQFKCICIGNVSYGSPYIGDIFDEITSVDKSIITGSQSTTRNSTLIIAQEKVSKEILMKKIAENVDFEYQQKIRLLYNLKTETETHGKMNSNIHLTLVHLALCHNVIKQRDGYNASSPDELALVCFAKYIGYEFVEKDDENFMIIEKGTEILKFKHLYTLEFSSQRKRMSVIVQDNEGNILLLCKGADDIMIQRSQCTSKEQAELNEHLQTYALQGLRTLVLAYRNLEQQQFKNWQEKYEQAITIVGSDRMEKINALQSEIEKKMVILGATAIQDKLQSEVKETITDLKKSGIKVWMLTGDKKQTAVSIGYACGLVDENSEKITLDCQPQNVEHLINNVESMLHLLKGDKVTIVSGQILRKMKKETFVKLSNLLKISSSVICCRVSPKDKETLAIMVKQWGRTLAVGDGANDVNMIIASNVGVGVKGIEGSQATRAADYVISQFKILKRLVLFHGLNFYYRNSNVTLYNLFKNIAVAFPLISYAPLSLVSSTYIYEVWIFQFFNICFTSLPIIIVGLVNIKFMEKDIENNPSVYQNGQKSKYFNKMKLLRTFIVTSIFGTIFLYVSYYGSEFTLLGQGYMGFEMWSGMLLFNVMVISTNIRIFLISNQISPILLISSILSVGSYYLIFFFLQIILYTDCKNVLKHQLSSLSFWFLLMTQVFAFQAFQWTWAKIIDNELLTTDKKQISELHQQITDKNQQKGEKYQMEPTISKLQKREMNGLLNNGGYAFAEDEHRSMNAL